MKIRVSVRTNKVGSESADVIEIDDADALNLDGTLNEKAVNEAAHEYLSNLMEWNWEQVDE